VGILLPAVGKARDNAKLTASRSNLRQLGEAHFTYASEWNDRQLTLVSDRLAYYGTNISQALTQFNSQNAGSGPDGDHAPIFAGFGQNGQIWAYWMSNAANAPFLMPINFDGPFQNYGWFRNVNFKAFNRYLSGKFYDPVFWAPKDEVAIEALDECASLPYEFEECYTDQDINFVLSSYVLSPAALFNSEVMRNASKGGFQDPLSLASGLRVPAMSQARYSDLKTQFLEHHWLQNTHAECNPNFQPGNFNGCEPYYFNHGFESVPMACFYDGHVEGIGVSEAMAADERLMSQLSNAYGLWSRDTPFGENGYLISDSWDLLANTSFHVLTTDGILGRDTIGE
jgi:hypothetical protein